MRVAGCGRVLGVAGKREKNGSVHLVFSLFCGCVEASVSADDSGLLQQNGYARNSLSCHCGERCYIGVRSKLLSVTNPDALH